MTLEVGWSSAQIALRAIERQEAAAARETPDEWPLLNLMERGAVATRQPDGSVAVRRDRRVDCFLFGPFWKLLQGPYCLSIHCLIGEPKVPSAIVLGVEIAAEARAQVAWRDFTADELTGGSADVNFTVTPQLSHDAGGSAIFEFRLFHFGNADIVVSGITLRHLVVGPSETPRRRWRLSGQPDPARAKPLAADGFVAVPRWAPGGQFLRGVGPVVGLPAAQYQLRFRCRAGAPRATGRPVLRVEIVNDHVSHQAFFYAAELMAGSGAIDFAVPVELGMGGGTAARVAARFIHLRNAALELGAIELVQTGEDSGRHNGEDPLPCSAATAAVALPAPAAPAEVPIAEPLRLRLPPGHVTLELEARSDAPADRAAPALRLELRRRAGEWPWRRTAPEHNGGGVADGVMRWDFAAQDLRTGGCAVAFDLPSEWHGNDARDATIELRALHHGTAGLTLTKLNLKQVRRDPKKNLMIVGNCHAALIYEGFRAVPALQRYFRPRFYNVNLQAHFYEGARRELETCELLVVQDISDWEDCPLRHWAPQRARTILFPAVRFASPWPFDGFNGPTDQHAIEQEEPNFTFTYSDGLLARLRREIPDRNRRFEAYKALNVKGIVNYVRAHQFETRRLLGLDRKYDCRIGQYILERFQSQQLFYTTNHPNGRIFEMIIANIMHSLEIKGQVPHMEPLDQLQTLQVPVHPKVAEALGVRWATPERKYRFRQEELTWEEYIRRYIDHYG